MGQQWDGSHGSWVTKDDPFPSLMPRQHTEQNNQLSTATLARVDFMSTYNTRSKTDAYTHLHETRMNVSPIDTL